MRPEAVPSSNGSAAFVVPDIYFLESAADHAQLHLKLPPELNYFQGHFTDYPILPGVVQIGWAIEFARLHVAVTGVFLSLSAVKFMRVITPNSHTYLTLEVSDDRCRVAFEYRMHDQICSSGIASFDGRR